MLQKLGDHIANCLARATEAERRAAEASDEAIRIDYEQRAKRWRHLASSYRFAESLDRFVLDADKRKGGLPSDYRDPGPFEPDTPPMPDLRRVMKMIGPGNLLRVLAAACNDQSIEVGICQPMLGLEWAILASDLEKFDRARSGPR